MRLYLLRHGQAGNPETWERPDAERPLTKRGVAETRAAARGMRWLDLGIDRILSSPYVRAHQTALIIAEELKLEVLTSDGLVSGCTLGGLAEVLATHLPLPRPSATHTPPEGAPAAETAAPEPRLPDGVLVVGHEPDLSAIIGAMIGRKGTAVVPLKKGGLCRVDLDPTVAGWRWAAANLRGSGALEWLLTAKQLGRLGG
jgi:phosphohistidine phosphatase